MTTITTTRHRLKFYLTIILGSLFFFGVGTILLFVFFNESKKGQLNSRAYFMPIFSLGVYFIAFYTVFKYFKNAPIIEVDREKICFNDKIFYWTELKSIVLTGKEPFKYIGDFPMEAATLNFKDGQVKYIFDDMYSNAWQVKSFLQQIIINKKDISEISTSTISKTEIESDYFDIFKGNQFISLRGISLWGLISFFAFIIISKGKTPTVNGLTFFGLFGAVWVFINSWTMNYFQVSQHLLVVKNHNLIWKSKAYRLSDIKEIVFETQDKMSNCLRVITKDFRNTLYPASTLRDKTWLNLKDRLEDYGIRVRNECI